MTREEAIERLKQNKAAAEFYAGMVQNTNAIENELKDIEAMNMAIEALQQTTWIPVGERLPSKEDCPMDCLVTRKSNFIGNYVDMAVYEAIHGGRE